MKKVRQYPDIKITVLLVLFHMAGLVGLLLPTSHPYFIYLVPFSILFLWALLVYINRGAMRLFLIFTIGVALCVFLLEVLGISSGSVFSKYSFGTALGLKLAAVPLMLGFYFVVIIYSVGQAILYLPFRSPFVRALTGSVAIIAFDYFLEPVAGILNYWTWEGGIVPYQNYLAWFILSFVLLQFFYALRLPSRRSVGLTLFLSQGLLFVALYFWL